MSDSGGGGGEKTEQPSEKKIKDAKERGQVSQSKELTTLVGIITLIICMLFSYKSDLLLLSGNAFSSFYYIRHYNIDYSTLINCVENDASTGLKVFVLPIIIAASVSCLVNIAQLKGLVLSKEAFKFNWDKLNLVSNAKSVFSLKNLIKFTKQCIEMTVMTIIAFFIFKSSIHDLVKIFNLTLSDIMLFILFLLGKIFVVLFIVHFLFSVLDFILEKRHLTKELMMTKHEQKEELKNTDGNPEIKAKQREMFREILEDDAFGMMPNSSIVLANPTHIAIVLIYNPEKWKLPVIVAKASGEKALHIFNMAKKLNIPIVRDKWLARQLFEIGEISKYVPESLLKYVADIIGKNLHLMPYLAKQLAIAKPGVKSASRINPL